MLLSGFVDDKLLLYNDFKIYILHNTCIIKTIFLKLP